MAVSGLNAQAESRHTREGQLGAAERAETKPVV
jgi:hypothetical protein